MADRIDMFLRGATVEPSKPFLPIQMRLNRSGYATLPCKALSNNQEGPKGKTVVDDLARLGVRYGSRLVQPSAPIWNQNCPGSTWAVSDATSLLARGTRLDRSGSTDGVTNPIASSAMTRRPDTGSHGNGDAEVATHYVLRPFQPVEGGCDQTVSRIRCICSLHYVERRI
jgi:hypothetical protein